MENPKDLPLPQTDLPLPEKEILAGHVEDKKRLNSPDDSFHSGSRTNGIRRGKWLIIGVAVAFLFLISLAGAYLLLQNNANKQVACTQEAKICPDGSSVGRTGPACEFSPCPTPTPEPTIDWEVTDSITNQGWKKYSNPESRLTFELPNAWQLEPDAGVNIFGVHSNDKSASLTIRMGKNIGYGTECLFKEKVTNVNLDGKKLEAEILKYTPIPSDEFCIGSEDNTRYLHVQDDSRYFDIFGGYDGSEEKLAEMKQIISTFKFTDSVGVTTPEPTRSLGIYDVCTQDAKQCPDGSYVSRQGPNCEFAACPTQ